MTRVTSVPVAGLWPEGKLDKIDTYMCIRTSTVTRFAYVSGCCFDAIHVTNSLLDTSQGQHAACVFVLLTICDRGQACRRLVWVQFVTMSRGVCLERSHI
jgi:hypothetical protein